MFRHLRAFFAAGVVCLAANAWIQHQGKLNAVAAENKLSPEETSAFKACSSQMGSKRFVMKSPTGSVEKSTPSEICVCHAKAMARTFQPNSYGGNQRVVDFLTEGKSPIENLEQADLKSSATSPQAQFLNLVVSLKQCTADYRTAYETRVAEVRARRDRN